jgi:hypothetical protein
MGALTDTANRVLRTFRRYTGDGLPGEPANAALPTGDPSSGLYEIKREDLRSLMTASENLYDAAVDAIATVEGPIFQNVDALLAYDTSALTDGRVVHVREYHEGTGIGGGHFYWDDFSVETADNGLIFGSGGAGRWKRAEGKKTGGPLKLAWFGVGKDSDTDKAALTAAIKTLNSGASQTLQCEGIPLNLGSGLSIGPAEVGFGGTVNSRTKYIDGLNLRAVAGSWAAGTAMLDVHGDSSLGMMREIYFIDCAFWANNLADYCVRSSEYYDVQWRSCHFINFMVAGFYADRVYGPGHGVTLSDCLFRVPHGSSTGKTAIIFEDGDAVVSGGWVEWCQVGVKTVNGAVHIKGMHFSLNDDPDLWKWGVVADQPRDILITECDFDGCGIYFHDETQAPLLQWRSLQVVSNDFVNTEIVPDGNAVVLLRTWTASNYINGLTISGNRVTRGAGATLNFVRFWTNGSGSWLGTWECVFDHPSSALMNPGDVPGIRRLTAGSGSDVVMTSDAKHTVRAKTGFTSRTYFHDVTNGGTAMPSVGSVGSVARLYNGTDQYVEVNVTTGAFRPGLDNSQGLGGASNRWAQVFAGTATISTSDERLKEQIGDIPDAWLDAWGAVKWQRYRMKEAVLSKGDDARWHIGLIAQQIQTAFADRGVDALAIGLLCYDEWPDEPGKAAGYLYGVRYEEALAMEAAWVRREISKAQRT